jgi:hypothetical protein
MADGLETLNKELIHRLLQERGLTLYQLEKCGAGGVSKNVWRRVRKGEEVRPTSRVAIARFLNVDPSTRLLLGEKDGTQSEGKNQSSLRPRIYRCTAKVSELCALGDDGRVTELTTCYYYGEIENATLTIRGTKAQLVLDSVTMYDDRSCSKEFERSSYRLRGHGPVVKGSVNIRYTAKDQTRGRSWAGVCVLSFPATGMIQGYWMTAGHIDRGITVLGRIELVQKAPQSLVAKSSEEAGGRDQREG